MTRGARIGLVGCGAWGALILRDLLALGAEVIVVDPAPSARADAQAAGAHASVAALEAMPVVDGAVVASPAATHAEILERLLDGTMPVFCEKPLTTDAPSARLLAERAPDRLFVMHKWRYHPGVEALGALARSGEFGPPVGLQTTRLGWHAIPAEVDVAWHLGPHDLSIVLEILGCVPAPRAAVAAWNASGPIGLVGMLGRNPWAVVELGARSHVARREVRLHCRDGLAVLPDAYADHVRIVRTAPDAAAADPEHRRIAGEQPLARELRAFLDHLRGGPPPRSSAGEAATIVETIAELRRLAGIAPKGARA